MGSACSRPQAVEYESERAPDKFAGPSPSKINQQDRHDAELNSPKTLIRAGFHHARQASDESPGLEQLRPRVEQREVEPQPSIHWACGDCIGQGAFGKVVLGLNIATGELMAVKQIRLASEQAVAVPVKEHVRKVEAEVNVLKQLHHTNIVRYLGTEQTAEHLNIFLEYVPGGSIASLLGKFGRFNEAVIKIYTRQILLGLEYLHGNGIMHRDIKGANILVDNTGLVKLADFGASKKIESLATIDSGIKQSIKGTPHWMAPEVIHQKGVGRAADIWSVACTVIEMATGKPPWSHITSQVSVMLHIAQTHGPPPLPESLSTSCRDFLRLCFNRSARDRPNAIRLLQHPFLAGVTSPGTTASPLTDISSVPMVPRGLARMEVPSPIQEESGTTGTPTSRGTGTTASSTSRRQERPEEDLSRFSPMGAAVRGPYPPHPGLDPVKEASLEDVGSSRGEDPTSLLGVGGGGLQSRVPPSLELAGSPGPFRYSIDDMNPMVEPTFDQENSPWNARGGRGEAASHWPLMSPTSPVRVQHQVVETYVETRSPKSYADLEANEEHILRWVKTRARTETARLSQSFQSLRPASQQLQQEFGGSPAKRKAESGPRGNSPVERMGRQAQWEAELEHELERQRLEQRRSNPVARRLVGGRPAAAKP